MLYVEFLFLVEKIKKSAVIQIKLVFLMLNFKFETLPKNRISRKQFSVIRSLDINLLTPLIISCIHGQSQKIYVEVFL